MLLAIVCAQVIGVAGASSSDGNPSSAFAALLQDDAATAGGPSSLVPLVADESRAALYAPSLGEERDPSLT
jgi:hypothetical protein